MPSAYRPTGLYAPVITPFAADGRVDLDALERLAAELLDAGATGLVALSTTGEPSALDGAERAATVAACARVCADRGAELIVGAGTNDTRTTIARHEALADVPAVVASLAVVPYYVRPSEAGIVAPLPGRRRALAGPAHHLQRPVPHRPRPRCRRRCSSWPRPTTSPGSSRPSASLDADTLARAGRPARGLRRARRRRRLPLPHHADGRHGRDRRRLAPLHRALRRRCSPPARPGDVAAGRPHAEALLPLVQALFAEPNPAVIKALLHDRGPDPDARRARRCRASRRRDRCAAALRQAAARRQVTRCAARSPAQAAIEMCRCTRSARIRRGSYGAAQPRPTTPPEPGSYRGSRPGASITGFNTWVYRRQRRPPRRLVRSRAGAAPAPRRAQER